MSIFVYKKRIPRVVFDRTDKTYKVKADGKLYIFRKKPKSKRAKKLLNNLIYNVFEKLVKRGLRFANRQNRNTDKKKEDKKDSKPSTVVPPSTFGFSTFAMPNIVANRAQMFYPGGFYQYPALPAPPVPVPRAIMPAVPDPPAQQARQDVIALLNALANVQGPQRQRRRQRPVRLPTTEEYQEEDETEEEDQEEKPKQSAIIEEMKFVKEGLPEEEKKKSYNRITHSVGQAVPVWARPLYQNFVGGTNGQQVFIYNSMTDLQNDSKQLYTLVYTNKKKGQATVIDEVNYPALFNHVKQRYDQKYPDYPPLNDIVSFTIGTDNLVHRKGTGKLIHTADGKGLSDDDCNNIMQNWSWYQGCIMRDELMDVIHDAITKKWDRWGIIINTQATTEGNGMHWCAIYCDIIFDRSIEYFDPFGEPPHQEIDRDLKKYIDMLELPYMLKYKVNTNKVQHNSSDSCGFISMLFLEDRFLGVPFMQATGWEKKKRLVTDSENRVTKKFGLI